MDMDVGDIQDGHGKSVKDIPPVPIKTYKWEDVRRAKLRGHYPYTHLTKDHFDEDIDLNEFKMDTKEKIKKSSSGVEIQEIEETVISPDKKPEVIITSEDKEQLITEKNHQESEGIVESADSSADDNISQYLEKDDKVMIVEDDKVDEEKPSTSKNVDSSDRLKVEEEDNRANRAKSEEPKRKRKLSIESAYSRISLPKFGVLKKLRAAKDKIKLTFSKSEPKLNEKNEKKDKKEKSSKDVLKQSVEPKIANDKPVYIHIPLKPPPGQTDEFSYLEFEDPTTPTITKKSPSPSPKPEDVIKETTTNDSKPSTPNNGNITNDVQFIILTAPSDDEVLDDVTIPESASSGDKKFFDGTKLKELKTIAKGCMDDIATDAQIDGIIFEDVIQVEYVDEHNNPIGTTERSSFIEINEDNLPTIEKQLSQRNILEELQKEVTSSMDSINKLVRNRSLRSLRSSPNRTRSNEGLKDLGMTKEAPELSSLPSISGGMKKTMSLKETRRTKNKKKELIDEPKKESKIELKKDELKDGIKEQQKVEQKMFVDEEDGLKISEDAMKLINEELEKENQPKTTESQLKAVVKGGDSLKKTVSFRRKSKQDDPDGVYEDVKVSNGKDGKLKDIKVLDSGQSMSVDEEKTYLDEKMIKTTSLEEDYNKWSKLTDHEYEPINPPAPSPTPQSQQEIKPQQIKSSLKKPTSIRIPLHDDVIVQDEPIETEDIDEEPPIELSTLSTPSSSKTPEESQKNKFQEAFKAQAGKIRTKFKNIKRPQHLDKLKIKKPHININVPKIPDTVKLNLPSFTLPKKTTVVKTRQYSTESNVGGTKKKFFDFSTYPRIFKRKNKNEFDDLDVTLPRKNKDKEKKKDSPKKSKDSPKIIRIPLHSEESMDREDLDLTHRYDEDIDIENDYLRESQEMHEINKANAETQKFNQDFNKYNIEFNNDLTRNRWKHGKFYGENLNEIDQNEDVAITDLDNDLDVSQNIPQDIHQQDYNIQQDFNNQNQEISKDLDIPQDFRPDYRSISSSGDIHRRGVLEEIDSDEFFLREKGISQDNIQISSQIKETFKPTNKIPADDSFETDQSVQEVPKRRPIKKPKRKKTPNVSREQISYEHESEPEEEKVQVEPIRPKRKPKKKKDENEFLDYHRPYVGDNDLRRAVSDNVLGKEDDHHFYDGDFRKDFPQMYENEQMEGIDQPNILLSDPYEKENVILSSKPQNGFPEAPPRKQKSLKSLVSEHDSIIDEITYVNQNKEIEAYRVEHEYIIPTPEEPPQRPSRTRSRTRSQSRTNQSERDLQEIEEQLKFEEQLQEQNLPQNNEEPCVEEPCVQTICDYMGYAIIDKSKQKDPPLPPPPRKKRSAGSPTDAKFFTCPRPLKDDAPIRPTRNYSTLVPKSSKSSINGRSAEKENVDIGQYIEIEDEEGHSRLQSGDVVKKMKDRPLPAPPRPPRSKGKEHSKSPLSDITNLNNVDDEKGSIKQFQESEVSVQTEPLPEGFVCEELVEEKGDKVLTPRQRAFKEFEHQETITHGALVVAPVPEKYEEGPITQFSRSTEKIITIRRETDDKTEKKEPETKIIERIIEKPVQLDQVQVLKAQKLQIEDLDVNRLTVNELLASKIKVSEIEGDSMKISEINPEGGNIIVGGVEFSGSFLKGLIGQLEKQKDETTSIHHETPPEKFKVHQEIKKDESKRSQENIIEDNVQDLSRDEAEEIANDILSDLVQELNTTENQHLLHHFSQSEQKKTPIEPPMRPPRQTQKIREEMKELEERILQDDLPELTPESTPPPPRPPQPRFPSEFQETIWSQPPPSFYMLRSPILSPFMDDEDIPSPPRRKRPPKQQSRHQQQHSESSSEDVAPPSRGRRHRTPSEPSIPQLAAQLTGACLVAGDKAFKRLIKHITANVLRNSDGRQDLHVTVVILLVLIAGLILLGSGGGGTTVHMHHWEYFNPPRDI
ncbi:myb-like protein X isoform X2 [Onthophagus taurus]|uniref:myb-like protein X isoform X2 n=1 Tax=Onthophagus taurus TaxID=166361 RepID=UPI0039BE0B1F